MTISEENFPQMRGYLFFSMLLGLCAMFLCLACEDETQNNGQVLTGRWDIVEGFRNRQKTETLSGTYFQFDPGGKMITNLPVGPEEQVEYELSKTKIRQKSTPPVEYQILSLSDTALILGLELRGMQFEMRFHRASTPTPSPATDTTAPVQDTLRIPSDSMQE